MRRLGIKLTRSLRGAHHVLHQITPGPRAASPGHPPRHHPGASPGLLPGVQAVHPYRRRADHLVPAEGLPCPHLPGARTAAPCLRRADHPVVGHYPEVVLFRPRGVVRAVRHPAVERPHRRAGAQAVQHRGAGPPHLAAPCRHPGEHYRLPEYRIHRQPALDPLPRGHQAQSPARPSLQTAPPPAGPDLSLNISWLTSQGCDNYWRSSAICTT
ncbi:hypothetical protein SAMN05444515_105116 [Ectothiorhodospira marina]|uniref:Uncharacterized protein n=1 Tax=Ectothiorhodospira marina TaxID=1396821 RepID=A0A1H7K2R3_9GAMM|nr:hypothetical protein SAMN05444515_105116 [Ectothiorhodospira marina]